MTIFDKPCLSFVLTSAIEDTDNRKRIEILDWIADLELILGEDVTTYFNGEMYLRYEIITFKRAEDALAFKLKFPEILHLNFL